MRDLYFDSESYEKRLSIAVLLPYLLLTIQTVSSRFIGIGTAQIISKLVVGIYFIWIFGRYFNRLCFSMVIDAALFTSIFILDSFIHINKVSDRLDIYIYFISTCLPIFVFVKKIANWDVFLECARKISYLIIGLGLFFLVIRDSAGLNEYNMSLGYYLLFPTICMLYLCLNKANIIVHGIFFLIGTIVIFLVGSRGPILGIVLFWGLYELFVSRIESVKEFFIKGIEIVVLFVGFIKFNDIVLYLSKIMEIIGLESRTLQYLVNGDIGNLSNRDIIYVWAFEQIDHSFFGGNGIGYSLAVIGTYCHNIILEMAVEFGVFIAFGIVLSLIILSAYKLYTSNSLEKGIILMWVCAGVVPLFVSSIYWEYMQFWMFLGVIISSGKKIRICPFGNKY